MAAQQILGWVIIVVGMAFVMLGFAGAVRNMFAGPPATREMAAKAIADVVNAFAALIRALSKAPLWLACVCVGFALIAYGSRLAFPLGSA